MRIAPFLGLIAASLLAFPAAAQDRLDFARDVWPIFAEHCLECHGPDKQNAGLRFDDHLWARDTELIAPSKPEESLVYKLITLPRGHSDIMPDRGDPLSRDKTDRIGIWIMQGADLGAWDPATAAGEPPPPDPIETIAKLVEPAPENALAEIRSLGALAMPLAMNNPLVRVDFQLTGDDTGDAQLASLRPVADQVTWLNLAKTKVTDEGLAHVGELKHLTSLHLENTAITDAGLQHLAGLENLQYLNLYGTAVTDAGLKHLEGLGNLRKLYLWQTEVTREGADALKAAIPGLDVNLGIDLEPVPTESGEETSDEDAPKADLAVFFDEGSCCGKAHAEGGVCEHACCKEAAAKNEVCANCNPGAAQKLLDALQAAGE